MGWSRWEGHGNGMDQRGMRVGWVVAKAKTKKQDDTNSRVQSSYDMNIQLPTKGHYSTTRPRQTCTDSGSHIRSTLPNWSPPLAPFHQLQIYMAGKKHPEKADQSTLASGGSKYTQLFSVAISWVRFCSDSHIRRFIETL